MCIVSVYNHSESADDSLYNLSLSLSVSLSTQHRLLVVELVLSLRHSLVQFLPWSLLSTSPG